LRSSSLEFLKDGSESSNSVITYARAHTQLVKGENNATARRTTIKVAMVVLLQVVVIVVMMA
jgi:hypothetical protein